MACFSNVTTTSTTTTNNNGTIAQLLKRIDQMQKEAVIANAANQCDNCMMNTILSLFLFVTVATVNTFPQTQV